MSTTPDRLVRCRVRDLASCFYACRLPLEEDFSSKPPPPKSKESSIIMNKTSGEILLSKTDKIKEEDHVRRELVQSSSRDDIKTGRAEPSFAEEDYIVFCFRDDGEIDMINEAKSSSSPHNQKLEHANMTSTPTPIFREQDEEKGSKEMDAINKSGDEKTNASSFESCDSSLSDTSTSSFAFPVLGIEWIGSPVHMPKSESHEPPCVCLHCCRF